MEAGEPISYMALQPGVAIVSSDGTRVGKLTHVLGDPDRDIFDGIVIKSEGVHRFVDADHVGALYASEVRLRLDAEACRTLPEPTPNPAVVTAGPDDTVPGRHMQDKLRRAWDRISGNY